MVGLSTGLKKLLSITACVVDTQGQATPSSSSEDKFEVMLNPAEFTHDYSIAYNSSSAGEAAKSGANKNQAIGKAAPTPEFSAYDADTVNFNLVIDGTGVVALPRPAPGGPDDVATQIENLRKIVYEYDQDEHRPRVVQILWGSYKFNCRLKSMSVQFTLFKPNGEPLRAKLTLSFVQYISKQEESARADRQSPDLTKVVEVKAGDTLPLLCYRIYKDSSYYAEVARVNNLVSFRGLQPGSRLVFPPLR